jgi:hypothetical protein
MSSSSGNIIPTVDNFTMLPASVLQTWPVKDIQQYSTVLGNVILKEMEKVTQYQKEISESDKNIKDIDMEIAAIDRDIIANTNAIIQFETSDAASILYNEQIDSTINNYNDYIGKLDTDISVYDGLIKDVDKQISELIVTGDTSLEGAAKQYSEVYIHYLILDSLYKSYEHSTTLFSSIYEAALLDEEKYIKEMELAASNELTKMTKLNKLYTDGEYIQSSLTQYRIDEVIYTYAYASTTAGILQLSTLYDTASMIDTYNNLLLERATTNDNYLNALSNYNIASQNTTTISGATAAGWGSLMATLTDRLLSLEGQIQTTSNAINTQITNSEISWVQASEAAVNIGLESISSLNIYMSTSDGNIKYYSSMYDEASFTMRNSADSYTLYDSYYNSTFVGSNDSMAKMLETINTYGNDQTGIDEHNMRVQIIGMQYTALTSSFKGNIDYSSLMAVEIVDADKQYNEYSTMEKEMRINMSNTNMQIKSNEDSIYQRIGIMNTESTIIDREGIHSMIYDTEKSIALLDGRVQEFKQRELYAMSKQLNAYRYHEQCIGDEVKNAAKTNTEPDINTLPVNLAYSNLKLIEDFVDTFNSVYVTYDNHRQNLTSLSTTFTAEKNSYSTFLYYKDTNNLYPNDVNTLTSLSNSSNEYMRSKLDSVQSMQNLAPTHSAINIITSDFMTRYMRTFPAEELRQTESTISSIWI